MTDEGRPFDDDHYAANDHDCDHEGCDDKQQEAAEEERARKAKHFNDSLRGHILATYGGNFD